MNRMHLGVAGVLLATLLTLAALVGLGVIEVGLRKGARSDTATQTPPEPGAKAREAPGRIEPMNDVGRLIEKLVEERHEFLKGGINRVWVYRWSGGPFSISVASIEGDKEKTLGTYPGNGFWLEYQARIRDASFSGEPRTSADIVLAETKDWRLRLFIDVRSGLGSDANGSSAADDEGWTSGVGVSGTFGEVALPSAPDKDVPTVPEKQDTADPGGVLVSEGGLQKAKSIRSGQESLLLEKTVDAPSVVTYGFNVKLRSLRPEDLVESTPADGTVKGQRMESK
ncbi:MAG: hypothetical protein NTW21_13845 [Verrucomicrobia bacterium]|nr:hypothetical protein [Verrucomicrobiota bacterium]